MTQMSKFGEQQQEITEKREQASERLTKKYEALKYLRTFMGIEGKAVPAVPQKKKAEKCIDGTREALRSEHDEPAQFETEESKKITARYKPLRDAEINKTLGLEN